MKMNLKKARLQISVLTNRNGIRGFMKRVSKHIIAKPVVNNLHEVDIAAIGRRPMLKLRSLKKEYAITWGDLECF